METSCEQAESISARIDRLPECRAVWAFPIVASFAGIFEVYDLYETAYLPLGLAHDGIFTGGHSGLLGITDQATFAAATFFGMFLGSLIFSSVSDRFGRRPIFLWALVGYSVASLAMAGQTTAIGVNLCRLLAGVGLGVELVTIDTYLVEIVPKTFRGKVFAIFHFVAYLGIPLLALLAYFLIPISPFGVSGWRWIAVIGGSGAMVVWWLRRKLPESPRWLAQQGRIAEAEALLTALERRVEAELRRPLSIPLPTAFVPPRDGAFTDIFRPPLMRFTIMLLVFNFFQTIGFFGFTNWLPTLLAAQGHSVTKSLLYSLAVAVSFPIWPLLWSFTVADRFERKWLIVFSSGVTAGLGLLFSILTSGPLLVACGVLIAGANTLLSFSYHPYQAELYPTHIRARAVGFVYSFSRLSTVLTSYLIAFFLTNTGPTGVFVFISISMLLVMLSIGLFGPRTRGRALEEIEQSRRNGQAVYAACRDSEKR
ncbi:MFS transporter, putative metabolite:H+ symporter [Enhydrobacter aerosaccus]|uniref:MFS transporter, putative metabolite:H+ symporter n=1 Tax=Enhydrobacter aerosaccus TaxID=225324 RepID=A0A1T4K1I6_9HYPH|nr:MFS transporter [Enhydrobacter aerosaccus]SJZ36243.1 MFS transporter, putative metabolite:H+ symporter [Enhydrobacter aerosaccus]